MNGGSVLARLSPTARTTVAACVLTMLLLQVGFVRAETPDEACAADSLYLISPEMIDLRLETDGRRGLTVSWPNLDLEQATCFSFKNTENLAFDVEVTGGFGDEVDRVFNFTTSDSGMIGAVQPQNIVVTWQNEGPDTYGNIGGKLNLSNNGGIWRYDTVDGWVQANSQLPMSWQQVNTVALAVGSGDFMLAGFSRGQITESDPVGLFIFNGTAWDTLATNTFNEARLITDIAIAPGNNLMFAVGTARDGLFITRDGGQIFQQWTVEFDPDYPDMPTNFSADVVEWTKGADQDPNRVYVFINNFGLFISRDNGVSFARSEIEVPPNLDVWAPGDPDSLKPPYILPIINALSFHPTDPDRISAALSFHGAYESMDGGVTWQDLYGDLVVSDPDENGMWVHTGLDIVYDDVSDQTMILGVLQKGLYRTTDGGATWVLVADSLQPESRAKILKLTMTRLTGRPGTIFVLEDEYSLLHSTDSGLTWEHFAPQPVIDKGFLLFADPSGSGDLTMGSWGGGIYLAGTPISLSDSYTTITSTELRSLDLGLDITFSSGLYDPRDSFDLVCQTFQGWAVWRGLGLGKGIEEGEEELDEEEYRPRQVEMTLLGLFDRVNPEDCIEGYCGDVDIVIVPNCFAAKRAACFECVYPDTVLPCSTQYPSLPNTIRFFDEEIYNGFTYNYSVTSFDYGNTALTTAENNMNDMIFSARYMGDQIEYGGIAVFQGNGNNTPKQINQPISVDEFGVSEEIYVFPNPLRLGAGFPRDEGGTVTFKNIPAGSKVLVFTTAGDLVIDIGPEDILAGNMFWDTHNSSSESITSGVYLYKVEIPGQDDYWGRLVVIR